MMIGITLGPTLRIAVPLVVDVKVLVFGGQERGDLLQRYGREKQSYRADPCVV